MIIIPLQHPIKYDRMVTKEVVIMLCPNCSSECENHARFCANCGTALTAVPREKKGRHWVPILIMILIFAFGTGLFFLLPGRTDAGNNFEEQMSWFYLEEGVLHFNAADYDGGSELLIPESIDGAAVTALSEGCFENCTELTSVILPSTLQAIGEDAFHGCTSLRGIEIPESVMLIGEGAFSGCTALEAVCVYNTVRSIGAGAFNGCTKLFYIYYSGYFQDWDELYGEFVNPYTVVIAQDGTFYQGETPME